MKSFGEFLAYSMPILLLIGPILLIFNDVIFMPFMGAICLGLGLFALSIKVDIILGHIKKEKSE